MIDDIKSNENSLLMTFRSCLQEFISATNTHSEESSLINLMNDNSENLFAKTFFESQMAEIVDESDRKRLKDGLTLKKKGHYKAAQYTFEQLITESFQVAVSDLSDKKTVFLGQVYTELGTIHLLLRNDFEATKCFRISFVAFGNIYGAYFYGSSILYGSGGIRKDVRKGIRLLNKACVEGRVGEAAFALGSIYERGVDGYISIDQIKAYNYYKEAQEIWEDYNSGIWFYKSRFEKIHTEAFEMVLTALNITSGFLRIAGFPAPNLTYTLYESKYAGSVSDFGVECSIVDTHIHRSVDSDNDTSSSTLSTLNWSITAQAFLFGATASLSSNVGPLEHYPSMLILLPFLGVMLSTYSIPLYGGTSCT